MKWNAPALSSNAANCMLVRAGSPAAMASFSPGAPLVHACKLRERRALAAYFQPVNACDLNARFVWPDVLTGDALSAKKLERLRW